MHIHRLFISALSLHRYPKESESKILTSTTNYLFLSPPKGFAHTIGISINLHIALKNSSIWIGSMGRCETTTYDDDECTKKATFSFLPPISIVSSPTWPASTTPRTQLHQQQAASTWTRYRTTRKARSILVVTHIYLFLRLSQTPRESRNSETKNPEIQKQITFCAFLRTTQFHSHAIYESEVHAILVHIFFRGCMPWNFGRRTRTSRVLIHIYYPPIHFYELIVCRCWCAKHDSYIHNTKCEARHTLKGIWWFYFP